MIVDIVTAYIAHLSYLAIVAMLVLSSIGIPFPEDIILLAGGYVASLDILSFWLVALYSFIGVLAGDSIGFYIGHHGGKLLRWLTTKERFRRIEHRFEHQGPKIILISRTFPGVRVFFPIAAGAAKMAYRTFLLYDAIAAAVWVPFVVGIGYLFGRNLRVLAFWLRRVEVISAIAFFIVIAILLKIYLSRKDNEFVLRKGERPYEFLFFGDAKAHAQTIKSKKRLADGRLSLWIEFFYMGKLREAFRLKGWLSPDEYRKKVRLLAKKFGKPKVQKLNQKAAILHS